MRRWVLVLVPVLLIAVLLGIWLSLGGDTSEDTTEALSDDEIISDVEDHYQVQAFLDEHPNATADVVRYSPTGASNFCFDDNGELAGDRKVVFSSGDAEVVAIHSRQDREAACVFSSDDPECDMKSLWINRASYTDNGNAVAVITANNGHRDFDSSLRIIIEHANGEITDTIPALASGDAHPSCHQLRDASGSDPVDRITVQARNCPGVSATTSDIENGTLVCED